MFNYLPDTKKNNENNSEAHILENMKQQKLISHEDERSQDQINEQDHNAPDQNEGEEEELEYVI